MKTMKYVLAIILLIFASCTVEMHEYNYTMIRRKSTDFPENIFISGNFNNSFIRNNFPYSKSYYGNPYVYVVSLRNDNDEIEKIILKKLFISFNNYNSIDLVLHDFVSENILIRDRNLNGIYNITDDLRANNEIQINNIITLIFKNININFDEVEQIVVHWELDFIHKSNEIENIKFDEYYYKNHVIKKLARFTT